MDYQAFADKLLSRLDRLDRGQIESFVARLLREFHVFEAVVEKQRDGVVLLDSGGRVALLNREARRILDVEDSRRGVGEPWRRLLRGEAFESLRALLERFEEDPKVVEDERVAILGRRRIACEVTLIPLPAGEPGGPGGHTLWILHDAAGRADRREEKERIRYVQFLATLTAGLAHEIRNPLNSLSIHASLLEQGLTEAVAAAPPRRRKAGKPSGPATVAGEDLERLQQSARILTEEIGRLSRIVDQFLTAARPVKLDRKPTRVEALFEQVVHLLGPDCREREIELVIDVDPDLPLVPIDAAQMYQVILNLAKNAIEAIGAEGEVALRARLEGDYAVIEVSDSGPGIAEEDQAKIFEPYYSTKKTGSGLGLMVVWRIVKAHGGAIALDSREGEGTTFSIALPLDSRPLRMLPGRTPLPADAGGDPLEPHDQE